MTTTEGGSATTAASFTAADRCDRCGGRAAMRVVFPGGGDLLFCAHHARTYEAKLRQVAAVITE